MQFTVRINYAALDGLGGFTREMIKNLGTGVPIAILGLANDIIKLGSDLTHKGKTFKLYQAWKVTQNKFSFTIYNIMPYATEEFGRGGEKIAGNPPLGPHNPVPAMMDLLTANADSVITKAILTGARR